MRIIIECDGEVCQEEIITYIKSIKIAKDLIHNIKFEN
jgi:hypothetical protein